MLKTRIVAVSLMLAVTAALAGPLPKAQIAVSAKWVVHLDLEGLAATKTCAALTNSPASGPAFQSALARYRTLLGVDPLRELRSVTLYGEDVTGSRGAALVSGNLRVDVITRTLNAYPQHRTTPWGAWTVHHWRDAASGTDMCACLYSNHLLVIGSDESAVDGALNVLNGVKQNLAKGKSSLTFPLPRDGVFFTAVSRGYAGSGQEPLKAMILRNTESVTIQIGEKAGAVDAGLVLTAVSPDAAQQIEQVLNGLIVAANLTNDDSGLAELAALCTVTRQDSTLWMRLNCPASQAAAQLARAFMTSR